MSLSKKLPPATKNKYICFCLYCYNCLTLGLTEASTNYLDNKKNWIRQMITKLLTTMTLSISRNLKPNSTICTLKKKEIKFPHR
jgi:hypothetical protein